MSSSYKVNRRGMVAMLNSDFMLRTVHDVGEAIKNYGEAIAPVGPPEDPHHGRYKASFHVRSHTRGGATHDRAEAIVWNDSPEALFVEFGSAGSEPYHTLLVAAIIGGRL
jgi:hypothetical protein